MPRLLGSRRRTLALVLIAAAAVLALLGLRSKAAPVSAHPRSTAAPPYALGPDSAAVPVRVADADAVRLLRPGDLIDLYAADPDPAGLSRPTVPHLLGRSLRVLAVPHTDTSMADGAIVVLRALRDDAPNLSPPGARLSLAIVTPP